jgi:hypothetical protein
VWLPHGNQLHPVCILLQEFFGAVQPGSWLETVEGAGHTQFMQAGPFWNWVFGLLCKRGAARGAEPILVTLPPLVAWMETHLRAKVCRRDLCPAGGAAITGMRILCMAFK